MKFNHSLCSPDIFKFIPKTLFYKKRDWHLKHFNSPYQEENIGQLLNYFFKLVIEDIIRNRVRFEFPNKKTKGYLEVDCVTGDEFKKQREKGAFQEIDFWATNFTGYRICYNYKAKTYDKKQTVYIGGYLKDLFYSLINNGQKY